MSEAIQLAVAFASFAVSSLSLFITIAAYRRLDNEASETFAVIGADEGNHESRLERLEKDAGLAVIPSPSALDVLTEEGTLGEFFEEEFAHGQEDAELRAEDHDQDVHAFENEGGAVSSLEVLPHGTAEGV